jgi:curved DNA-binding protein CbpA
MSYDDFEIALRTLGLPARATLAEIRQRHRTLVKRLHPDAGGSDTEAIRAVNEAYRLLQDYCRNYRFDFSRTEFLEQNPEERLREQFAQDAIWRGR